VEGSPSRCPVEALSFHHLTLLSPSFTSSLALRPLRCRPRCRCCSEGLRGTFSNLYLASAQLPSHPKTKLTSLPLPSPPCSQRKQTVWGENVAGAARGKILMKFAELIEANLDELAALESLDSESFPLEKEKKKRELTLATSSSPLLLRRKGFLYRQSFRCS